MALFWFLLALVLLAAALALLWLDARKRGDGEPPVTAAQERLAADRRPADDGRDDEGGGEGGAPDAAAAVADEPAPTETESLEDGPLEVGPAEDPPTEDPPAEAVPLDPAEPTAESSPRLLDKVRAILPARRQNNRVPEPQQPEPDPLAGSPVVRWLEDREFAPTPTPAPEFRHGDFAVGLSALGTVSHGMFRGRRAIMGVTGGRAVLALRRDTASDVVLDLSRPDVDVEPGFHDAGRVGELDARTSDYGRLDLLDRERLADAVSSVPAPVRRIWAEGEWVAATIDHPDDPSSWDDVVMALHGAAAVVAPFPPIGGRARALPAEIDPGAPGAADGPDADPTVGMDGEVGTGTHGVLPPGVGHESVSVEGPATPGELAGESAVEPTMVGPAPEPAGGDEAGPGGGDAAEDDDEVAPEPRRTGHLRLVPDRPAARDLTDAPVVADRGDAPSAESEPAKAEPAESDAAEPEAAESEPAERDPFAEIMEPAGPVQSRGDVAADFLPPRPPLSRPTRGVGHTYPEDASVPPLASGATAGGAGIKPLGSEDEEEQEEIAEEVKRFDAARIDGRSDLDDSPSERGRHRRENVRYGLSSTEPDVEQTARLDLPDFGDLPEDRDD